MTAHAEEAPRPEPVREWAWRNGHPAPQRGRLPRATVEAWRAAHPDAPELAEERRLRTTPGRPTGARGRFREPISRSCVSCGTLIARVVPGDRCAQCRDTALGPGYAPLSRPGRSTPETWDDDPEDGPSRLSGVELTPLPGEIILSGGVSTNLRIAEPTRDEQGRVLCGDCGQAISRSLACGCDEGEYDNSGEPLDPRWATGVFLPG